MDTTTLISCLVSKANLIKHVKANKLSINVGKVRRMFALYSSLKAEPSEIKPMIHRNYRIVSGIVLTRSPQILRDLHPFEKEYYLYQQKLEQIHSIPFPEEFYFKKGSIAEMKWKENKERDKRSALAIFSNFNKRTSTDIANNNEKEEKNVKDDDKSFGGIEEEEIKIASRITQADLNNDMKSLNRALQRTLYLIVKKPRDEHAWQFPQGGVNQKETLVQAATRELEEECGNKMDAWFVGRRPIGYYKYNYSESFAKNNENNENNEEEEDDDDDDDNEKVKGAKVFFMKAHIFAGQVHVDNKEIVDFAWVTKQEMEQFVSNQYYISIKDMLSEC